MELNTTLREKMNPTSNNNNNELREFLYVHTKRAKWDAVIQKYAQHPEAQGLKLTRKGETALHLAVITNQEQIVETLVKLICKYPGYRERLETTNERKSNPLHLAAFMGSVRMCHAIASAHGGLLDKRNIADETPLFLAAVYGKRDAFYCLYSFCRDDPVRISGNCRLKNNGDTVIHYALRNQHFELAYQLIHINSEAMNWVNEDGCTPLHVLANKPTSFKSGSHIRGWRNFIYYCIFVNKLEPQTIETLSDEALRKSRSKAKTTDAYFPKNYETCYDFFTSLKVTFLKVSGLNRLLNNKKNDEANNGKDLEKDVNEESENFDSRFLKAGQSAETDSLITNFPRNYATCVNFFRFAFSAIMIVLGFGSMEIRKIYEKKQKHTWSVQVMDKLLEFATPDKYCDDGKTPMGPKIQADEAEGITTPYNLVDDEVKFSDNFNTDHKPKQDQPAKNVQASESVMLLAARNGVIEIVRGLYKRFPLAIYEARKDKKNVVLLAAEYRQPDVYRFLLNKRHHLESLFRAVDHNGNSALHLAAAARAPKLWLITGAALQMQWETKWYKYVKESVPLHFFAPYNKEEKTASTIFQETHMGLVKSAGNWLRGTSESCSVVATLIATVAFATAANIPGGYDKGAAVLEDEDGFFIFAISSLIALCLSSTSVIMFLAILTSRLDTKDFGSILPWKLLIGLSSLYLSIIAMLISFCSGHYFLTARRLQNVAVLLYTLTFLPVALIFGIVQLPLYFDLLQAILKIVPKRSAAVVCN